MIFQRKPGSWTRASVPATDCIRNKMPTLERFSYAKSSNAERTEDEQAGGGFNFYAIPLLLVKGSWETER